MSDKSLFARLKKLFSQNVVVRNVGGMQLKVADTDNIQAFMSNATRDRYSRLHAGSGYATGGNSYGVNMAYQTQRIMLFRDYDIMDNDPIIASALDIYSDESTVKNEYGEILTIHSDDSKIMEILHNLFYDILNIEFNLWPWIRNLCKYGDLFLFLEISPDYGIHNVLPLSVYDTLRIEGEQPQNPYYVRFETLGANGAKANFENFEIAHFRLLSDSNFLPYGKGMIEAARRVFRQLSLMEDAMMIHRIMRAPEKRVFKIDIGNIPPNEVDAFIRRMVDQTKKVPFMDSTTGDYNLRYNMQNLMEDFYLPVRGGDSGTSIENLGGLEYNAIDDIEYLRNKMMAALKIPKAFLGYDENVNGKATLAAEDVRFARTIERIQRIVVSELTKIAIIHLYAQGFTDESLVNFSLSLTNPSTIYEQEKVNLWTQKVGLVAQISGIKMLSDEWVYKNVFEMSEEDMKDHRANMVEDQKYKYRLAQIEQGQSDPAKFGFPQEQEAPPPGEAGAEGGPGGPAGNAGGQGAPPAAPAPGGAPAGGGVSSVEDLPTAEELGLEEETRGAPRKGPQYGQDSHVRGRDPLGFKERYKALKVSPERQNKKSILSVEMKNMLKRISPTVRAQKIISEQKDETSGTFLDEAVLIDDKIIDSE
jgi:capsid assembly protein Gp20